MSRFLTFIAIAIAIVAGIHYYLWARFIRDPQLPFPWNVAATVLLMTLAASMPAALLLGRSHPTARQILAWPAFVWMGIMFLLVCILVSSDLVRGVASIARKILSARALDQARRTFIARCVAVAAAGLASLLAAVALRSALGPVDVRRIHVRLARLPRVHDGLRIVQLTDLHVGPTIGRAFVEEIVRRTNELGPDIVAITGDLVDGSVSELRNSVSPLASLHARHGVFFVTGNHEYFSDADSWANELTRLGIRVLRNERVAIGDGNSGFDLAGVDDCSAARHGGLPSEAALAQALAGRDPTRELVLLAHQPRVIVDGAPFGIGLQLSGHTHGGQLWPFTYLVHLQQPFVAGLHRLGNAQIYVSRGTGYWGPPMRLGAPAEITEITLAALPA